MVDDVDVAGAQVVTPKSAPVSSPSPLTGKERAGVNLTWGVLAFLAIFLVLMLSIYLWGECRYLMEAGRLIEGKRPLATVLTLRL
jgi:hypothetical protein